ncbi:MAG TPA: SIMPL domain-containing protein [Pyrinomonadaceae bacterium]|nr:SIMPL domain-containing protein [Pyrinomonadaceae bacterium]
MKRIGIIFGLMAILLAPVAVLQAQTTATQSTDSRRVTRVLVTGDSIVRAQPDTATLMISVVTQAKNAIDAQQENAVKSDAVIRALKAAVPGAEIKTSGYSIQPQRVYRENQPPTITGYEARNAVTVTLSDLKKVGTAIDAASQAGANDLGGVMFTLKQDRPARDKALSEATSEAVSKAKVIAQALGGRVVRIVEVQEEGFRQPIPVLQSEGFIASAAKRDVATPIEVGDLEISSRVQLIAEVETNL